jgi:hypothetical protein
MCSVGGCISGPYHGNVPLQNQLIDGWIGASATELTGSYGAPDSTHSLENDVLAYAYTRSYTPRPTDISSLGEELGLEPDIADTLLRNNSPQTRSCTITFIVSAGRVINANITRREGPNLVRDICAEMIRPRGDFDAGFGYYEGK